MFSFFNNFLYPSKKFLTAILKILKYDPSSYDIDDLDEQLNDNEECELLNGSIDVDNLNKKLKLKKFLIGKITIKKSSFVFKKNYLAEKTIISLEDVEIDILQKNNNYNEKIEETNEEEEKEKSEGGFLDTIINSVIHNLLFICKNLKIRFFDKENKNVEFSFFLKKFDYKDNEKAEPIKIDEKMKYLFLHNKSIFIDGILLKEKYEEKDDLFFSENEDDKDNINKLLLQSNNLFYIKKKIEIDMFFNIENQNFKITNNNDSQFYIESIFNIQQLDSLYKYFSFEEDNKINENVQIDKNSEINKNDENNNNNIDTNEKKEEKKTITLMGIKIEKIILDLKMRLFYFILLDNNKENEIEEKLWISHQENEIKNIELKAINKILFKNFNSLRKNYYLFSINDLSFTSTKKISLEEILLKFVEPNKAGNKEINNINNNKDELKFDDKNIINIKNLNLNLETKKISYNNIYLDITPNLFYILKLICNLFPKKSKKKKKLQKPQVEKEKEIENINGIKESKEGINIINEENNQDNIINTNDDKKEEDEKPILEGQNLNIKIFLNNNEEIIKKNISFNDIFYDKEKADYINLIISNIKIIKKEKLSISYDKLNLSYNDIENNNYSFFKILKDYNKEDPKSQRDIKNIEIDYQKELIIDLPFIINLYINGEIIKNILNYSKFISQLFGNKGIEKEVNIQNNDNIKNNIFLEKYIKKNLNIKLKDIFIYIIKEKKDYIEILNLPNSDLPKNAIEERNNNEYICINLSQIEAKLQNDNNDTKTLNINLKSLIIHDKIPKSIYKIMLSKYAFDKEEEIFMNCNFMIKKDTNFNKLEIIPSITIAPIAIYLDQISLLYLLNTLYQIQDKKEKENKKDNDKKEITSINDIEKNNNDKYLFNNTNIEAFFVQLNYSTNKSVDTEQFSDIKALKYLTSLTNLNIDFKEYKNENNKLPFNEAIKHIYEFYFEDIMNQARNGKIVSALPLLNQVFSILDGAFDIVREPVEKYKKNESIMEGIVIGTKSLVINTFSMFTYLGESFINSFGCVSQNLDNNMDINFCRGLRNKFNEKNKSIEDYYLK